MIIYFIFLRMYSELEQMEKDPSLLYSTYVIDGVRLDLTPEMMLRSVMDAREVDCAPSPLAAPPSPAGIVDETPDVVPKNNDLRSLSAQECLDAVRSSEEVFPLEFSSSYTRFLLTSSIIDTLWLEGSFKIGDLCTRASWKWNPTLLGSMAAFYHSVSAACDCLDSLGICLEDYECISGEGKCSLAFTQGLRPVCETEEQDDFISEPYRSRFPEMGSSRLIGESLVPEPGSWVIYIPFDTSDFRLGASRLSALYSLSDPAPRLEDSDYFLDCYEVLREFSEDGVLLSAATVGPLSLMDTLSRMCSRLCALDADISGIMDAYGEKQALRVLFSNIPGVVIQIRDQDFDYLDAELLLQDVAYYPLGHPDTALGSLKISTQGNSGLQSILASLLRGAEGED